MKKIRIGLMLLFVMVVSVSTRATGTLNVDVFPGQKDKVLVNVLASPNVPILAQLENKYGNVVYSDKEESSSYNFKKLYDFSNLNDGTYTFVVKSGNECSLNNLIVKNGNVQITDQEEQLTPHFKLDGKYLEFYFPNGEDKDARLLLYDKDNGYWVYQESLIPEYDIKQALNLSKLNTGDYMAVLISGKRVYNYDFELN